MNECMHCYYFRLNYASIFTSNRTAHFINLSWHIFSFKFVSNIYEIKHKLRVNHLVLLIKLFNSNK